MDPKTPSSPKDAEEKQNNSDAIDSSSFGLDESKPAEPEVNDSSSAGGDSPDAGSNSGENSQSDMGESSDESKPADDASVSAEEPTLDTPEAPASTFTPSPEASSAPVDSIPSSDAPTSSGMGDSLNSAAPNTPPPSTADSMSVGGGMAAAGVAGGMMGAAASKKKTTMIIAIVAIVLVVLLGGAAFAAYYVMNKPQNVLGMALQNSFSKEKNKSVAFEGDVKVTGSDKSQTLTATYSGAANQDGAMQVDANIDALVTNITVNFRTTDASTYYLKVGGLNGLPQLLGASSQAEAKALAPIIAAVNDQWFEINQSLIKQLNDGKDFNTKLSDADRKVIVDTYKKNQFLIVKKTYADETIKNVSSHHYQVVVDKTKLKAFVAALKSAKVNSASVSSDQYASLDKAINDANFDKYPVDVWIGKSNKMIEQVAFSVTDDEATASFRYTVNSYNQPVTVQKPAGAKSLLDVLGQLFGGGGGTSNPLQMLPGLSL